MVADLAACDPVAALKAWIEDHPVTVTVLGGPEHVTGIQEAPWPHLVLGDGPGGDLRGLVATMELEVTMELYGAPDGSPGQAALWRKAVAVAQLATRLPDEHDPGPGEPIVSRVRPAGVFTWAPTSLGQPRYVFGVYVVIQPAHS